VKARILPLDSAEHQATQQLLPWWVNGSLDAAGHARVEAHLAECPRCQADAAWQARLRAAPEGATPRDGVVERDWAALRRRLPVDQVDGNHGRADNSARDPGVAPPPRRAAPGWQRTARWLPLALGIQAALVLALVFGLPLMQGAPEAYRALGAAPGATGANALVVFDAGASEAQVRSALRASGARLLGGPTVTDAYLLQLSGPEALQRLRAQPGVARVESLDAGAPK
jgi:anti-sigma factor RsiW